jgi:hypothetical protein
MKKKRNLLMTKILKNIPQNIKPVEYLVDLLQISKESAYRRMRGDIPFSFDEIATLSLELEFSIDEIIERNGNKISFNLYSEQRNDPVRSYLDILDQRNKQLNNLLQAKEVESLMVVNHISPTYSVFFDNLFKFSYYKWLHQSNESSLKFRFSDVKIPEELARLQKKIKINASNCNNATFILDPDVFFNLIKEIQYYYKRKLLNEDELQILKKEMSDYIDMLEQITQTGSFGAGGQFNIYLLSINTDAHSSYFRLDDKQLSHFYIYSTEPIVVTNPMVCSIHKKWIESMKKYATLITQSNEMLQTKFFDLQRTYINEIEEKCLILS